MTDGNGGWLADRGLVHLAAVEAPESSDLEWSAVTDAELPAIAGVATLRWVDLGGAAGVTAAVLAELPRLRPVVVIEGHGT